MNELLSESHSTQLEQIYNQVTQAFYTQAKQGKANIGVVIMGIQFR
jgi:hypothetical protein